MNHISNFVKGISHFHRVLVKCQKREVIFGDTSIVHLFKYFHLYKIKRRKNWKHNLEKEEKKWQNSNNWFQWLAIQVIWSTPFNKIIIELEGEGAYLEWNDFDWLVLSSTQITLLTCSTIIFSIRFEYFFLFGCNFSKNRENTQNIQ